MNQRRLKVGWDVSTETLGAKGTRGIHTHSQALLHRPHRVLRRKPGSRPHSRYKPDGVEQQYL